MSNEIIYTNLSAKPTRPTLAPTPEAPAEAPAPQVKRITWGIHGRLHMPATAERQQPQRDERPSRGRAKVERSAQSQPVAPEAPKVRMRYVDRGSRLERLPEQRLLYEKLERQAARTALEHLTILHSQSAEKYWIADAETGEIFLRQPFATLQHCHEAAAELERTFAMAQVLDMRSPETLERMEAIALAAVWRETVELEIA